MKIAVSVSEKSVDAEVEPRFGRTAFFLLFDSDADSWEVVENARNRDAVQGAGIQSAQTIARLGVDVLLSGHCGPKAYRALSEAGVKIVTGVGGKARDAVAAFQAGKLVFAPGADVEGHWE